MKDCIFCKIINKEIPSKIIYEDNDVIAFLDISQQTFGHTLVLPKKHYDDILSVDEDDLSKVMKVVKLLSNKMMKKLPNVQGLNIINNCKEVAGQTVKHIHIHIIPRYQQDEFLIEPKNKSNIDLDEVYNLLKD